MNQVQRSPSSYDETVIALTEGISIIGKTSRDAEETDPARLTNVLTPRYPEPSRGYRRDDLMPQVRTLKQPRRASWMTATRKLPSQSAP